MPAGSAETAKLEPLKGEKMTGLRAAAMQALEALECLDAPASGAVDHYELQRRADALRSALEAPEHQFLPDWTSYRQGLQDGINERAPDGRVLVPVSATPAMIRAYRSRSPAGNFCDEAYRAMIAAAPKP